MRNTRDNDLTDRRNAAAIAKAALLEAYLAKSEAARPTQLARQEERLAIAAASEERRVLRENTKREEKEHRKAQAADHQAEADAAAGAEAREKAENPYSRSMDSEAARKAERDRRYANRRAKQR